MEGKRITSTNPIEGTLSFLGSLATGTNRRGSMTDKVGDITVDTTCPTDTNIWETGIIRDSVEGKWIIVSQYEDEEEATKGHKGWLQLMTDEPNCELKDIDMWGLGDLESEGGD